MVKHILQTPAWAEVRATQGSKVVWFADHLMLIKPAPKPFKAIGIMSQVAASALNLDELKQKAEELGLSHVQIDPNEPESQFRFSPDTIKKFNLHPTESLLLRHTQLLDLTKSEEELLSEMDKNWRYNCKYAQKQGLEVEVTDRTEAVEDFIKVFFQTVDAKGFLGRDAEYYRQVWKILRQHDKAKIILGRLQGRVVVARMIFHHDGIVYTAYTGTSRDSETNKSKAAYGVMWELMRWAKESGFHTINMWGVAPEVDKNHPYFGFTHFKLGFGGEVVTLAPAYDLVVDTGAYRAFQFANVIRIFFLKLKNVLLR